ncbi:uncharacterized protein LOC123520779 [Portunus trituberculatus]|uniref:uncharacterized protein LOC123520779 n=1 Tax=Portunus trituberculatus TaxID=210409 RepID=UPI001E1CF29D|nr:uncharacterized protein LOC123520779 [Portunus trituberculatus]
MDVSGAAGDGGQRFCGGRMSYLQGDTVNRPITAHLMGPVYVVTFRSSDPEQRPTTSLGLGFMLTFRQRHSCTDFSSLSSPPDPVLSDVETEWPAGWSLDALLPDGHEIEMLSRNASIFPSYPLPTTIHSHVDVFPSHPFTSIGNHHAMNFYKREGLVKENNETIDGKYSEDQDQQKPIQQQQQQPESKNVKEAERNGEGPGNGAASASPSGAGHSLSRVSNILSATLTQVFPEFGHSLQDLLERRNAPSQADQQEV